MTHNEAPGRAEWTYPFPEYPNIPYRGVAGPGSQPHSISGLVEQRPVSRLDAHHARLLRLEQAIGVATLLSLGAFVLAAIALAVVMWGAK